MPGSPHEQPAADTSVRHLVELGYVDPASIRAGEEEVRRQLEHELQQALQLRRSGQSQQAVATLERLTSEAPDWPQPHQLLAEFYYQLGDINRSEEQIDWLTYHGVEHPRIAIIVGATALTRRKIAAAIELLEYVCFVEPNLQGAQRLLGMAHLRDGNGNAAEECFNQAIKQNEADSIALDGLSSVCLSRGEFERAADYALQALERDMGLARAHYHLGIALACLGRHEEAYHAFDASTRAAPLSAAPYYRMYQMAANHLNDPVLAEKYRQLGRMVVRKRRQQATSASTQ